jgi:hypothetical protein
MSSNSINYKLFKILWEIGLHTQISNKIPTTQKNKFNLFLQQKNILIGNWVGM